MVGPIGAGALAACIVAAFTGAAGETVVDTTNNRLVVQDGALAGGYPAAKLSEVITNTRTAISDAASYRLLRGATQVVYSGTALTATDSGLSVDGPYAYTLVGVRYGGHYTATARSKRRSSRGFSRPVRPPTVSALSASRST